MHSSITGDRLPSLPTSHGSRLHPSHIAPHIAPVVRLTRARTQCQGPCSTASGRWTCTPRSRSGCRMGQNTLVLHAQWRRGWRERVWRECDHQMSRGGFNLLRRYSPTKTNQSPLATDDPWANVRLAARSHAPSARAEGHVERSAVLDLREVKEAIWALAGFWSRARSSRPSAVSSLTPFFRCAFLPHSHPALTPASRRHQPRRSLPQPSSSFPPLILSPSLLLNLHHRTPSATYPNSPGFISTSFSSKGLNNASATSRGKG